ncbi:MAG: hypothetical protein ACOCV2_02945 [Persicimonas sp.]
MVKLPVAAVSTIHGARPARATDGIAEGTLSELVELLDQAGVLTPSFSALVSGRVSGVDGLEQPALLALCDDRLEQVAAWSAHLAYAGFTSLVACAADRIGEDDRLSRSDAPLLSGHGVVVASRGCNGAPLVDLPVEELRRELRDSRQRLSKMAGYAVRILMPQPTSTGRAVDGLVLEEARRAGYHLVLRPGRAVGEAEASDRQPLRVLPYRRIRTDDSPQHLRDWIVGRRLARGVARLRGLVDQSRRFLQVDWS